MSSPLVKMIPAPLPVSWAEPPPIVIIESAFSFSNSAFVLAGLKKAWTVKLQKGMVTQIGSHKQNAKKNVYWTYKVNGKTVKKGVQQQKVKNKDKITFNLNRYKEK
jgi:hypothetical protein